MKYRQNAFTRKDLCILIGLLMLLIVAIFAVSGHLRQRSRTLHCQQNLKSINAGMTQYTLEHDDYYPYAFNIKDLIPPPGGYLSDGSNEDFGRWWLNYLSPYNGNDFGPDSIYRCPSRQVDMRYTQERILIGNYGVNLSICRLALTRKVFKKFEGAPERKDLIESPDKKVLLTDCGYAFICWWQVTPEPPHEIGSRYDENSYLPGLLFNRKKKLKSGQLQDATRGRHYKRTVNVNYADGHIENKDSIDLMIDKTNGDDTNRSSLW